MNIMFLHEDPVEAARCHCVRHVHKQLVEAGQLLSTAHGIMWAAGQGQGVSPPWYRSYNPNGRFVKWLLETYGNRIWLYRMAEELGRIYPGDHVSWELIKKNTPYGCIPFTPPITRPAAAFNVSAFPENRELLDGCVDIPSTVAAYREYYRRKNKLWSSKGHPMQWYGDGPEWMHQDS